MTRSRLLLAALALAAVAVPLAGQDEVVHPRPIVIIGGTLFDGTGAPPRRNDAIVIRDGRITDIGLSAARRAPRDARLIEGTGKWIVPGFVDAAVRLTRSGNPGPASTSVSVDIRRSPAQYLRAYLCSGITTVLDVGGPAWTFDLRDGRADEALSPAIETTGPSLALVTAPGPGTAAPDDLLAASSPDAAAAIVDRLLPSKPALVAVRVSAAGGPVEPDPRFANAAVAAAHARKLRALVEASTLADLRIALDAGADVVVSRVAEPIDDGTVQRIVRQKVTIVPVLAIDDARQRLQAGETTATGQESACAPTVSLDALAAWKHPPRPDAAGGPAPDPARALAGQQENVRRLAIAGAVIVAGSGAGSERVFHGPSLHREFELLADAGLTPAQIILSATREAAIAIGRQATLGQIKEGMAGDLLVLGADPLIDIRNAAKITHTIRAGALYER